MRLFVDESLSPRMALALVETGRFDAVHPTHIGRSGQRDDSVLAFCLQEDRVIVTHNAVDFRRLVAATELHPGLILLTDSAWPASLEELLSALAWLETRGDPADLLVNHLLEAGRDGRFRLQRLP